MKSKFAQESFTGLPQWAKGIIAVAVVGAIGFIGYKLYKKSISLQENKADRDEVNAANSEATQLANLGIKPTLTGTKLTNAVNGIKGAWLEYDYFLRPHVRAFYRELVKVQNDLDMVNLIAAYKTQTVDFPVMKFTANDFTGTLTESVKHFLSGDEVNAANKLLAKQGIKNRF
jgi:hypothetical protein